MAIKTAIIFNQDVKLEFIHLQILYLIASENETILTINNKNKE
jgi:hypothetical protein